MAQSFLTRIEELDGNLLRMPFKPSHDLQVQKDLKVLQRMVRRIQAILQDAEERSIHDESVKLWLRELKGIAYDADDVLDEYEYELRAKVEAGIQADETANLPSRQKHKEEMAIKWWRHGNMYRRHRQNRAQQRRGLVDVGKGLVFCFTRGAAIYSTDKGMTWELSANRGDFPHLRCLWIGGLLHVGVDGNSVSPTSP